MSAHQTCLPAEAATSRVDEALPDRCRLLNVTVHPVDLTQAVARLDAQVRCGRPHQVVTVNLDFVRWARQDPDFCAILNGADLAVADGMPLVWASRVKRRPLPERVAGVDLVDRAAALAAERGYRLFLLGAAPGVADVAAANLIARYPSLTIAGSYSPPLGPFAEDEDRRIIELVREARPDILLVALGAPRQEQWIHKHRDALGVPVCIGVGATFDFFAGVQHRAPSWMQRTGFEWMYRLLREPRRLWRRYIVHDLPVFVDLMRDSALQVARAETLVRRGDHTPA